MDAILNSFLYIQLLHDTSVVLNNWPLGYLFNILFTVKKALNLYIIVSFFMRIHRRLVNVGFPHKFQ